MDILTFTAILIFIFSILCLGTGIYAFNRYSLTRSERLFVVGLSMVVTAVGIACGALDNLHLLPAFSLSWAWYAGTSIGFFLLFLSSMVGSADQFLLLRRWGIIGAAVFMLVIVLTPVLPSNPNTSALLVLNSLRSIICFLGFLRYIVLYTSKETRFSLLMCLAFLSITVGYVILVPQILDPSFALLAVVGAFIRIIGAGILFTAFIVG